jgi:lysophospholipase L1-like esterase
MRAPRRAAACGLVVLAALLMGAPCRPSKPARLAPKRLYSIGDSITRAFDAWAPGDNLPVSWVNGYHGFLEELLGVPDVWSHNQRITAAYGSSGRRNVTAAENGARWDDALDQAQGVLAEAPTYVTIMLGGNDVCRDEIEDLPSDAEIQGHVHETLAFLDTALPGGATVLVIGIPDIKRLHDVGLYEKGLLGIDCELIWETTALGFPCGSMLSPDNSEADRLYVQSRNFAYNDIIEIETRLAHAVSSRVYFHYLDAESVAFTGDHISSIDCFHPSDEGQELIAELAWEMGPFGQ